MSHLYENNRTTKRQEIVDLPIKKEQQNTMRHANDAINDGNGNQNPYGNKVRVLKQIIHPLFHTLSEVQKGKEFSHENLSFALPLLIIWMLL